ncbi:uncharacterized protein LOC131309524 [Rhododendron vialii]|uniref:uncharacterized protein LOC131309524 n=1 Tax=Rhododendron vialii TaxID=182163 RepID=UPI00265EFC6C|nr:uncharacterized protein LOC131309524 [Rhododendron vialii]
MWTSPTWPPQAFLSLKHIILTRTAETLVWNQSSTYRLESIFKTSTLVISISLQTLVISSESGISPKDETLVTKRFYKPVVVEVPNLPVEVPILPVETLFVNKYRRFNKAWFSQFSTWIEYSIAKDAAFCLCCYLFKPEIGDQAGGDKFVGKGYSNWKKKKIINDHVGGPNSAHNQAWGKCEDLLNQRQHIQTVFDNQSNQARIDYRIRLNASVDSIWFLVRQGLAFRGHDESEHSSNQGNFLELLKFLADHNEKVKGVALDNAPQNLKLIASDIQKDIISAAAFDTMKAIVKDLGDSLFSVLVDEARDISIKEQMAVAIWYVDRKGNVIERFMGIEHVANTDAFSLKEAMGMLFCRLGLSMSRLRGQGYDGASNMQGEFNGLKTLILNENSCAYYVHCFAHQLQLALVAEAMNHEDISMLFYIVNKVVIIVGVSCKRLDILKGIHYTNVVEALSVGELSSGQGLNQETNLKRPSDTRWGSHYGTLISILNMFLAVINVLQIICDKGTHSEQRSEAKVLKNLMRSFEYVLSLHLMKAMLAITSELSQALQRKDQDIVNAIYLVQTSKKRLKVMRDSGWDSLFIVVSSFYEKHGINVPNMDDKFVAEGKGQRKA